MSYITHDYRCLECDKTTIELVPRQNVPDDIKCECGAKSVRIPSGSPLRLQIEEATHGGRMTGGKLYRQHTGFKEMAEERALESTMKKERKKGNKEAAKEAEKALKVKRKQNIADATK